MNVYLERHTTPREVGSRCFFNTIYLTGFSTSCCNSKLKDVKMQKILQCSHKVVKLAVAKTKVLFTPKYLLLTNTAICVTFSGVGDGLQQFYEKLQKRQETWDRKRTMHMLSTGFVIGPACHYWYNFLDKRFVGTTLKIVTKKVLVDQLIFSPINITLFFIYLGLLEGSTMKEISVELIQKGKYLYMAEWLIWPPAMAINFYFLPTRFRVLFDSTVSIGFDYYYSYVKHRKDIKGEVYEEFRDLHEVTCSTAQSRRSAVKSLSKNTDNVTLT